MRPILYVLLFMFVLTGCVEPLQTYRYLPPGIWRGVLMLDRQPVQKYGDDRDIVKRFDSDSEVPFNFEVVYDNDSIFHIIIHNADERITVTDIVYGRDKATAKDTIIIDFPVYDTKIRAIYEDGVMEGDWIVNYKDNYSIPFKAVHGVGERFPGVDNNERLPIGGKWSCTFEIGTEDEFKAVGIFEQNEQKVKGTFLTETGDYRYLEGKFVNNKLYLSAFDGAHAFLFLGKLLDDGTLTGTFRSGSKYATNWEGKRDANATLKDAYSLTSLTDQRPLDFSFVNTDSKIISIKDEQYKGKIKIIQIMGTWCPNCMDETIFLKEYMKNNPSDEVSVISIGFERYKNDEQSIQSLRRFKERMHITHEILYGGYYDKKTAREKIPQLDKIMAYPTLIVADRNNRVVKIHTGFNGPATPLYQSFKEEFAALIQNVSTKK